MTTDALRSERDTLAAEAEDILNRSDSTIEGPDRGRFDAITGRLEEINSDLERRAVLASRLTGPGTTTETGDGAAGVAARQDRYAGVNVNRGAHQDPWDYVQRGVAPDDFRARALAAIEKTPLGEDQARELGTRLVERDAEAGNPAARWILASANPEYMGAVSKLFRDPERGFLEWSDAERAAFGEAKTFERNMALTGGGTAAFMAPFSIDPTVNLTNAGTISSIRKVARVEQIVSYAWHGVTSAGSTASWDAEATEVSDDSPVLAQPTIVAYKGAAFVGASIEAAMDTINLAGEVSKILMDAKDRLEATAFVSGTGSGQPFGSVTELNNTTASRLASSTNGAYGAVDVYALIEALPARHRLNATWHMALPMINRTRRFSEALGYNSSFLVDLAADSPPRLVGKALFEESEMTSALSTATASSDSIVMIGDFRNYLIADRVGTMIEFIPHLFGASFRPTGQRGWYAYFRTGADWINLDAGRILIA